MRASLSGLVLILLTACSQVPVQPAPAQPAPPPVAQTPPPAYPPPAAPQQVPPDAEHRLVRFDTNLGSFTVQLDHKRAPLSVDNFLAYVNKHYYDNTSFYRIVPGFVIQAGDYTADYQAKTQDKEIPNESGNGLSNGRGTIAMARQEDPHTATSAFYINLVNNRRLDPRGDRWGYAVFGTVVDGLDVVDKIAAVPTHSVVPKGGKPEDALTDAPVDPVTILKVTLLPLPAPAKP